jgi:hypothetical protein
MPALAPEDEPPPRRSHDIKLLCNCDRRGRLGQSYPRKEGSSRLRRDTRSPHGGHVWRDSNWDTQDIVPHTE